MIPTRNRELSDDSITEILLQDPHRKYVPDREPRRKKPDGRYPGRKHRKRITPKKQHLGNLRCPLPFRRKSRHRSTPHPKKCLLSVPIGLYFFNKITNIILLKEFHIFLGNIYPPFRFTCLSFLLVVSIPKQIIWCIPCNRRDKKYLRHLIVGNQYKS